MIKSKESDFTIVSLDTIMAIRLKGIWKAKPSRDRVSLKHLFLSA